jgi:NAD(P)-dependent dehydrogenase (short-subunit alcohol dehydrogenase family)
MRRQVLVTGVRFAEDCERAVGQTIAELGRLDILFNNAGVYVPNNVLDCSEEEWDLQVDASLKGTFLMCKYSMPHMIRQGGGSIINNSSGWGLEGGDTVTPMEHEDAKRRGMTWDEYGESASNRPLGRMGDPREIARAVLFFASIESSFVTVAALPVDGGGVAG